MDLNVVATASGKIVEVQGTAEGEPVERARRSTRWWTSRSPGSPTLAQQQRDVLARAGVDLDALDAAAARGSRLSAPYVDTLVVATTNRGKLEELRALLAGLPVERARVAR